MDGQAVDLHARRPESYARDNNGGGCASSESVSSQISGVDESTEYLGVNGVRGRIDGFRRSRPSSIGPIVERLTANEAPIGCRHCANACVCVVYDDHLNGWR